MQYELRPYQKECLEIINNLPDGSKSIINMATGLGKTVCFTNIDRKGRTLILSHRDELVRQPLKYFPKSVTTGIEKAEEVSNKEDVVSASVQTISKDRRLAKFSPDEFDTIIVDEAHHAAAPSYRKVLDYFKPRILLGFTATPKRGDNVRLDDIFDNIVFERNILWGIRNNYLCNLRCLAIDVKVSLKGVKFTAGDYNTRELSNAVEVDDVYEAISKTYGQYVYNSDRHVLLYCLTKKGCEEIKDRLVKDYPEEKDRIAIITADTPQEERNAYEQDYMNPEGNIRCLINCMVLTEGVDLPITDTLIICRPTANTTLYTQIVGRGTRPYEGKKECLILEVMPKSTHKLCSMSSLVGIDWDKLKRKQREMLEQGVDLITFADDIEQDKQKFQKKIDIVVTKIELFEDKLKDELEEITSSVKNSVSEYSRTISANKAQMIEDAKQEDGEIDHCGLRYEIGMSDEERYVINGEFSDECRICIAKPDTLGNSHITATIKNKKYQSNEMKINECFKKVSMYLQTNCSTKDYLWNEEANQRWKKEEASEKQLNYIFAMLSEKNYEFRAASLYNDNISKYDASMLISKLNNQTKLKKQIRQLKAEKKIIEESENKDEEVKFDTIYTPWDTIEPKQMPKTQPQVQMSVEETEDKIVIQQTYELWGSIKTASSQSQIDMCVNLVKRMSYQLEYDCELADLIDYICYNASSVDVSRIINMMLAIDKTNVKTKCKFNIAGYVNHFKEATNNILEQFPQYNITKRIAKEDAILENAKIILYKENNDDK